MSTAYRFLELADQWADHCRATVNSSNTADYVRHPAFDGLVALGPAVVPLVMARFEADDSCPWEFVLAKVTGAEMIDDPDSFSPAEVYRRRLAWWAANRHRYEPAAAGA